MKSALVILGAAAVYVVIALLEAGQGDYRRAAGSIAVAFALLLTARWLP